MPAPSPEIKKYIDKIKAARANGQVDLAASLTAEKKELQAEKRKERRREREEDPVYVARKRKRDRDRYKNEEYAENKRGSQRERRKNPEYAEHERERERKRYWERKTTNNTARLSEDQLKNYYESRDLIKPKSSGNQSKSKVSTTVTTSSKESVGSDLTDSNSYSHSSESTTQDIHQPPNPDNLPPKKRWKKMLDEQQKSDRISHGRTPS